MPQPNGQGHGPLISTKGAEPLSTCFRVLLQPTFFSFSLTSDDKCKTSARP